MELLRNGTGTGTGTERNGNGTKPGTVSARKKYSTIIYYIIVVKYFIVVYLYFYIKLYQKKKGLGFLFSYFILNMRYNVEKQFGYDLKLCFFVHSIFQIF